MRRALFALLLFGSLALSGCGARRVGGPAGSQGKTITGEPMPEFTETSPRQWVNGAPLRLGNQRGKVVLVEFWTFG